MCCIYQSGMPALCICRLLVVCICSRCFDPYLLCILNFHSQNFIKGFSRNKKRTFIFKFLRFISILLRSALCKILYLTFFFFLSSLSAYLHFFHSTDLYKSQYFFILTKISHGLFTGVTIAFSIVKNANLLHLILPAVWASLEFSSHGQCNFIFKLVLVGELVCLTELSDTSFRKHQDIL